MRTEAHIAVTSLHLGRGSFEPGLDGQGFISRLFICQRGQVGWGEGRKDMFQGQKKVHNSGIWRRG